jgi:hypothetical protein
MGVVAAQILAYLKPLFGLKLAIARRAADMLIFQFGEIRIVEGDITKYSKMGTVGEYALHIQCAWRIEGPDEIVTGQSDLWKPADADAKVDWDSWDYDKDANLQDARITALLGGEDPVTGSPMNFSNQLVVESVDADDFGGATIQLSGGYRLVIFPAGTRGEDWRIFRSKLGEPHFVISGGSIK